MAQGRAGLSWHTSLSCNGGQCVTVAADDQKVLIANSTSPDELVLAFTQSEWHEFLAGAKNGDFDNIAR
jgi:hypothetical protein